MSLLTKRADADSPLHSSDSVTCVIVTHNSQQVIGHCIAALFRGTQVPDEIIVMDSGSTDTGYLDALSRSYPRVRIMRSATNIRFCAANNRAIAGRANGHVLLLNPDAFVTPDFLEGALARLVREPAIGALGPKLLRADPKTGASTGVIDSAGIDQRWWGRFVDRGAGKVDDGRYDECDGVVALCGAAILLRREALIAVTQSACLFDERFVMYKEDLDVCFRLQREGWKTVYDASLTVLHCRGWQRRSTMPRWGRRLSLTNEWRLWRGGWTPGRHRLCALPYLLVKSIAVRLGM